MGFSRQFVRKIVVHKDKKAEGRWTLTLFVLLCCSKMAPKQEMAMAVGLKKGHKVTKNASKPKPSRRKGVSGYILDTL